MRLKTWIEDEAPMGANLPDMLASVSPNRGSDTPASSEVKRTGLQPQVDAQEIDTKQKREADKIQAIDAGIQHLDKEVPQGKDDETPKLNKFKELWDDLKAKWEELKVTEDDDVGVDGDGLGNQSDPAYEKTMRDHPNMVPTNPKMTAGIGAFGLA